MKAPKSLFDRPGRAAAVVGAVVVVSATAAVALVSGTATAAEPGRCTKNVNVRAQPDIESKIVALCEQGTEVQVGESRTGFLRLDNLGGWAAQEYISVNGQAPAPADRSSSPEGDDAEDDDGESSATNESRTDADDTGSDGSGSDGSGAGEDGSDEEGADEGSVDDGSVEDGSGSRGSFHGLGGLLG